ncbi:MAG: Fe-S-containing protein [Spirochaetaceae bacterium]|jgi:uncharacterized membrane protein|nr:Fe-S-containing protein [Spirochaetaceae bacterium]
MLRYFFQVIENLLTTGILAALLFSMINKIGYNNSKKHALTGCAAGMAAALILAVLRRTTALINRGFFNSWILSFAILFGFVFIFFLWKTPQKCQKTKPPQGGAPRNNAARCYAIQDCVQSLLLAALMFYAMPTIFLYPTEFALPGESIFSTSSLFKFIGFIAGLLVVILSAAALYKTCETLSKKSLKILLTIALALTMCSQALVVAQFLLARRIIPMILWLFNLIIITANITFVFFCVMIAIGLSAALLAFISGLKPPSSELCSAAQSPVAKNPAALRKVKAALRVRRRWRAAAAGFVVSILAVTLVKDYTERETVLSPAEPMELAGDEILIPITQIEDGHLHRFAFTASGNTEMRFIVIKKNAAAYGVGLDACDICGPTGYYERKNEVICRLCDVVMNISTIGFKGGCNPVPLAYTLRDGFMVIEIINLENEKNRFK